MDKHYQFTYKGIKLDPYRILKVYGISDPAQQHAIKKLLRAGESIKVLKDDIKEVIKSLTRWLEMLEEDSESSNEIIANSEDELDRIAAIDALRARRRITTLDWPDGEYLYLGKDGNIRDENDVIISDNAFNEIMEDHSVFYIYKDEELVCEEFDVEPLEEGLTEKTHKILNKEEVLKALREGYKLTCKDWDEDEFLIMRGGEVSDELDREYSDGEFNQILKDYELYVKESEI